MSDFKKFPWYALLAAIYFPLILLVMNIREVRPSVANRIIIILVISEILLIAILWIIYRDWQKAGFAAILLTVLLLTYGHVYSVLENIELRGFTIGHHRYMLPLWLTLILLSLYFPGQSKKTSVLEGIIKPILLLLVVFALLRLGFFYLNEWKAIHGRNANKEVLQGYQTDLQNNVSPDVYYIILDAYGRSDVLSKEYDVDNSVFISALRSRGFFVAECSQSNYAHTHLSLASSLNYDYLENLGTDYVPGNKGWAGLTDLIQNSAIRQFFEKRNYQDVAFDTGYSWTEWRDADHFIESKDGFFSKNLTSFESLFLYTTIGKVLMDFGLIPEPQQAIRHYEMISSNLNSLQNIAREVDSPKFVFAHLVIPHPPFVFDAEGNYRSDPSLSPVFENYTDEDDYNGYRQQVIFINKRILEVVDNILSNSDNPPIIIIQGDHGPSNKGMEARMSILNAYYLPDGPVDQLDAGITPVNTFRVILTAYFGQNLPILPNASYFSKTRAPYAYTVIPKECKP